MSGSYLALMASVFHLLMTEPTLRVRGIFALLILPPSASCGRLWFYLSALRDFRIRRSGCLAWRASPAPWPRQRPDTGPIAGQHSALPASLWHYCSLPGPRSPGPKPPAALVIGVIILDFAVQAVHVTNQSLIFAARPDAQSRLVGAYMGFYSVGSALGAVVATQCYALWGWNAVCLAGAGISAAALIFWLGLRKDRLSVGCNGVATVRPSSSRAPPDIP